MLPRHPFLRSFGLVLLAVLAVHVAVAAVYLAHPESFYYRAWEYFFAWANKTERMDSRWQGVETSDLGRRYMFLYQEPRSTVVTTDADGFRSVPDHLGPPRILVQGRSNVFGSGVSDHETYPWQLAELSGVATFNGAHGELLSTLSRPGLENIELVIDVVHERHLADLPTMKRLYTLRQSSLQPYTPIAANDENALTVMTRPLLRPVWWLPDIMLRQWRRLLTDLKEVRVHGRRSQLALPFNSDGSPPQATTALLAQRCKRVEALGYRYLGLVIPARHVVYGLPDKDADVMQRGREIAAQVEAAGCPMVNLFNAFTLPAAAGYYFNYDTHWSPGGQTMAAKLTVEELALRWPTLLSEGSVQTQTLP
ncbi:MAG: hypothetical protein AAGI24_16180 [Pseudomonadota bacterium]